MARFLKGTAAVALALFIALSLSGPASAQTKNLRMANWIGPVHHMYTTLQAWVKEVERASGGTLKIKVLEQGLAKPPGQYDLAKNGIVDLAWGVPGYTPGRFHMVRVHELPFMYPNAEVGSLSLWQWYDKHGFEKKEFADTKLIMLFGHGKGLLHSKNPVRNIADVQGLKIRAGGAGVALAKHIGAVPVSVPASKAHEALQRGTAEAIFFPFEAVKGFRLAKLVKYHLDFPGGLYSSPFYMVMNLKSWNGLSEFHRGVLRRVGGAFGSQMLGRYWEAADADGIKLAKAENNTFSTIGGADFAEFQKRLKPVETEWIAEADRLGYQGAALLADLRAIVKANSD